MKFTGNISSGQVIQKCINTFFPELMKFRKKKISSGFLEHPTIFRKKTKGAFVYSTWKALRSYQNTTSKFVEN